MQWPDEIFRSQFHIRGAREYPAAFRGESTWHIYSIIPIARSRTKSNVSLSLQSLRATNFADLHSPRAAQFPAKNADVDAISRKTCTRSRRCPTSLAWQWLSEYARFRQTTPVAQKIASSFFLTLKFFINL